MEVQAHTWLQLTALLQQPSDLFLNIPRLLSYWDGVKEDNWDVGKRHLFLLTSISQKYAEQEFISYFSIILTSGGQLCRNVQWVKIEATWASLWNFGHLQVLLFRFMMVPEGYIGNETPVCFVLTKRSNQICVPEHVLSGVLGRESRSCCHMEDCAVFQHWWDFHGSLSKQEVCHFSEEHVCAQREPYGFSGDHYWILARS